jgi:thymidine kinase
MDFRGEPFAIMPRLLAMAELVEKLTAICVMCGGPATRSQRLVEGNPAKWNDPVVLVGASDAYEPRCRRHHVVPEPPNSQLALPIAQLAGLLARPPADLPVPIVSSPRSLAAAP